MDSISLPVTTGSSYYGNKYFLHDSEGLEIISTPELGYTEDVLEEIALAINAHDDLLAACESILVFLTGDEYHKYYYQAQVRQLRAAIAKAKGDQC